MARASKLEDYWQQHNIEGLFKELTRNLTQRMPPDPAVAIVQYLQNKFPKSFKTSPNNNNNTDMGVLSKSLVNNLQLQSTASSRSDTNVENTNNIELPHPTLNSSQVSDIVTLPTTGTMFTDLLKRNTNTVAQAPELDLRNLVFANRISQTVVKNKNIRSDQDILQEELIRPTKTETEVSLTTNASTSSVSNDNQVRQKQEEPSVSELIQYKNKINTGKNYRKNHQKELAELAQQVRNKEKDLQPDLFARSNLIEQDSDDKRRSYQIEPDTSKSLPTGKSEEDQVLNAEIAFHCQIHRNRDRNKLSTAGSKIPHVHKQHDSSLKRTEDANAIPPIQFVICKTCGSKININENQSKINSQQDFAMSTVRSFQPQISVSPLETNDGAVDDWFDSASEVSSSRQRLPNTSNDVTPQPTDRNLFRPIKDNSTDTIQSRPPTVPLIITNDETKPNRSTTPRTFESDFFVRTPEPTTRRFSSPRNTPSPVTKKRQTNTLAAATTQQVSKPMAYLSRSPPVPITERRMSGWSVRETSLDDSDES